MNRNDKTLLRGRACQNEDLEYFTTIHPDRQPRPGTALCSFLRRHRDELISWNNHHGDRQSQGLIDCCTALLDSADRGQP